MKLSIKILILIFIFKSFGANSKAISLYCKSDFGGKSGTSFSVYIDMQQSYAAIDRFNGRAVSSRLNRSSSQVWFEPDKGWLFYINRETLLFRLWNTSGAFNAVSEEGACYVMKNNNKF